MKNIYPNWDKNKFLKYTNHFKLPNNKRVKDFSRGMKMKLSIAVALSHNAKLLILDEATSGQLINYLNMKLWITFQI